MSLGELAPAVQTRLEHWDAESFAERLWAKDPELWPSGNTTEISNRLGWLELPRSMALRASDLKEACEGLAPWDRSAIVLIGMGGSSLAPEVFHSTVGSAPDHPQLRVVDSTHPDAVRTLEDEIDITRALFVVSSKSGTTLETLSLFRYFWDRVKDPSRFVAVSDRGSPLAQLGGDRGFARVFYAPSDVGGRYSALTEFGLVPAALVGIDLESILVSAAEMAERCSPGVATVDNPGLMLGAALGEAAVAGRDKVTFLSMRPLAALPSWLEQLVAESTGKEGRGILPVIGEAVSRTSGGDRFVVAYGEAGDSVPAGVPRLILDSEDEAALGGEMFRAEFGIAAAGAVLGINPFDQPDVQAAKEYAGRAMNEPSSPEPGLEQQSASAADASLEDLLAETGVGEYVAIHAYLAQSAETDRRLFRLRRAIEERTSAVVTVGYGPRFLHSTGQMHKGGPNTGRFIQLIDDPTDLPVPETSYGFGELIEAQALGDALALQEGGRRLVRIKMSSPEDMEALLA